MEPTDPADLTDEALVASARQGRDDAFETLLHRHEGRVLRVLRLLGVRELDREDLAQEVFVRVFRSLEGFRPGRSFGGWIYRISVNAVHDHRRRLSRRIREQGSPDLDHAQEQRPDATDQLERQDSRRRLESALERISERERAVFVLVEMEELETREVAAALGITRITVRRHLSRARTHLRQILEESEKSGPDVERSRAPWSSTRMRRTRG